jgi:hypothetical protein
VRLIVWIIPGDIYIPLSLWNTCSVQLVELRGLTSAPPRDAEFHACCNSLQRELRELFDVGRLNM